MIPFRLLGPMALYTGYSVGFRGLVKRLLQRPDLDIDLRALADSVPDGVEEEIVSSLKQVKNHTSLGVLVGFPKNSLALGTRYKVIYSMYEADDIPFSWKSNVATANEVWVPSRFCAEVFGRYNKRVRIVPWGIDTGVFRPGRREGDVGEYVFGAVGVQSPRKGTDVMIDAFNRAFGGREGVRLIIKTRDTRQIPPFSNPMIDVIDSDWPEERLAQFYRDIDCLVECSRGEGIGMPPLQAVFSGTPALVTDWSGMRDYINGVGVWGVRIKGLSKAHNIGAESANWAEPDAGHLAELMQWAVDERPRVTGDFSRWSLESMAGHFEEYLRWSWRACHRIE